METNNQPRLGLRVWVYSFGICVVGVAFAAAVALNVEAPADQPFQIPWPVIAAAFVAAEWLGVNVEVKRQAQTLNFTEAPIVLGLLLADPTELVIARVVVAGLAVAIKRRPSLVKMVFNIGNFALQIGAAMVVFHVVVGDAPAIDPIGWVAALLAVTVSYLLSALAVTVVLALVGAPVKSEAQLLFVGTGLLAGLAGAAVSLGAAATLWHDQRSWVLLAIIGTGIGYFFVAFLRIRERHQSLATLHEFTTELSRAATPAELSERVAHGIATLLKAQRVVVLAPSGSSVVRIEYQDGAVTTDLDHDGTDLGWVSALGGTADSSPAGPIAGVDLSKRTVISVRLPLPENPGLVLIDGRTNAVRDFDDEDVQLLETAAGHAATAIHNAQLVDELREEARFRAHQALRDEVTDLPNSRGLAEDLARPLALREPLAVLTVRIDSLREVNETLGRAMGDELLHQIAARLVPLGPERWCAKTASDEFTLVVPGGPDEADMLANRIVAAFDQPMSCGEVDLAVNAGIGVALAPEHGTETEMLLRRASLAASRCKVEGTKVTTWASDRDPYDPQRLAIAADLRTAIPRGELEVHFQPQVDIGTGLVTGAEALVRWKHPRMGQLRPDQFIAAAEYTGAIDALTAHVLEVAATTCARWRALGWDLEVAVNVSARNLADPNFASQVGHILSHARLEPSALTLELTESSVMTEAEGALSTLDALHQLGISWSIDDFGTGFSSLAHLRRLPVSEIKIDKSFVFDLTTNQSDEAIVRSMIELGRNLGMTVVVEGVETVEVRRRLDELRADRIQGYLLSRPMPADAFEQWIADRPVRMASLDAGPPVGPSLNPPRADIDPR